MWGHTTSQSRERFGGSSAIKNVHICIIVVGYDYDTDPRAIVYERYDKHIEGVEDMKYWLLNNDDDDPRVGIAPRYDLAEKPSAFGLTDLKIITPDTIKNNYIWAISGPTLSNNRFPAFKWEDWATHSHVGMPRQWNFPWIQFPIDI